MILIFVWKDHSAASECQTLVVLWFAHTLYMWVLYMWVLYVDKEEIFEWKDHFPVSKCQTLVILWFAVAKRLRTKILPRPENLTRNFRFKVQM